MAGKKKAVESGVVTDATSTPSTLTQTTIRTEIAGSEVIYERGESLFLLGNYTLVEHEESSGVYRYAFDGTYGSYAVTISLDGVSAPERPSRARTR